MVFWGGFSSKTPRPKGKEKSNPEKHRKVPFFCWQLWLVLGGVQVDGKCASYIYTYIYISSLFFEDIHLELSRFNRDWTLWVIFRPKSGVSSRLLWKTSSWLNGYSQFRAGTKDGSHSHLSTCPLVHPNVLWTFLEIWDDRWFPVFRLKKWLVWSFVCILKKTCTSETIYTHSLFDSSCC